MSKNETAALAVAHPASLAPSPSAASVPRAIIMREAIQEAGEQRKLLGEFIASNLVEGTDFGTIPGTGERKVLLKPGAEKLVDIYRCSTEFERTASVENWEKGFFHYEFRARIRHRESGVVFAEGLGSANSMEAKYRWRQGTRKCPACGKETIIKGKVEYGGGWVCFAKKGGCGEKWADGAKEIEAQEVGRVANDDPYTSVNTLLKMAQKRALVAAALTLARVSDLFTQDLEDAEDGTAPPAPGAQSAASPPAQRRTRGDEIKARLGVPTADSAVPAQASAPAADGYYVRILALLREHGIDPSRAGSIIRGATGKTKPSQLDADDLSRVEDALLAMASMPMPEPSDAPDSQRS